MRKIKVVLGYGLGVDSTAIAMRWHFEPWTKPVVTDEETGERRPAEWDEILIVTAMTGNEWEQTGYLVKRYMLPLLAADGARYVQLARKGPSRALDGHTVLSDSAAPAELYLKGDYRLDQEMNGNGTVPQVGGTRKCSIKAKGEVIDDFLIGELDGAPFLHVIGFEANEVSRSVRDAKCNTGPNPRHGSPANRTGLYPLIEWNWDRTACEAYITEMTGATWIKSACTFCPFALTNQAGIERVKGMYSCEPRSGVGALIMEYRSISLNPNQGLIKNGSLLNLLRMTGEHNQVLRAWGQAMRAVKWRIYEVQRVAMPTAADPSKGVWRRSVRSLAEGTRDEMLAELSELAASEGTTVEKDDLAVSRAWISRRGDTFPTYERLYVVAPAGAQDKTPKAFHTTMAAYRSRKAAEVAA